MQKIKGIIAAAYTPMDDGAELKLDVIQAYADFLKTNGVAGVFLCGTTGESASLSVAERMKVTEAWAALSPDNFSIIVQVGHNSLKESKLLAKHAREAGADAISVIAPSFFKPTKITDLIAYCSEIALEASDKPFYFYHIPSMTGVNFDMLGFMENVGDKIPNFTGIKFTHENLMDYGLCVGYKERKYDMLFGRDEILLSALSLGAQGAVGSTYNLIAPLYNKIIESFKAGEMNQAQLFQIKAMEFVRVLIRYGGGVVAGKAIMKLIGMDCGPARLPLGSVNDTSGLQEDLKQLGFFGYCSKVREEDFNDR